ncbi:CreA family protein [Diaphorobacter sp. HDW4B]|uniref:CreA family protein n=1 Tax=Diaphorobacter sp. HDW4B TaxID=2714925 RepID=UPI0014072D2A|nr:CreA family protein [Diaphorobacter sp. HDW4B]QIL70138.1 CreA family protein [Diaphorobacter sp. HDW4B]
MSAIVNKKTLLSAIALTGLFAVTAVALASGPEKIGTVDTAFKLVGRDHDIIVEAYDDPDVQGVTCYVSRARTGGVKGSLGLAEDRSEASISCHQVSAITFPKPLKDQDEVFSERTSLVFKRLRVVRMVDVKRNALVYLTYSDKLIDGSPQNSVSAVPVAHGTQIPLKK